MKGKDDDKKGRPNTIKRKGKKVITYTAFIHIHAPLCLSLLLTVKPVSDDKDLYKTDKSPRDKKKSNFAFIPSGLRHVRSEDELQYATATLPLFNKNSAHLVSTPPPQPPQIHF